MFITSMPGAPALSIAIMLASCATPTPYQPLARKHTAAGGYSD